MYLTCMCLCSAKCASLTREALFHPSSSIRATARAWKIRWKPVGCPDAQLPLREETL
jgi:hypothetical protein